MRLSVCGLTCLAIPLVAADVARADPCTAPLPPDRSIFAGRVTMVIDGDGLCVGAADGGIEVRLADFDAPDGGAGGRTAAEALRTLALGKEIACRAGPRSLDRTIARCELSGVPIGTLLRASGVPEGGRAAVPSMRRPSPEERLAEWIRREPRRLRVAGLALVRATLHVLASPRMEANPSVHAALEPDP